MRVEDVVLPAHAIEEKFLAATGPGGQNVNKVAAACQLRVDLYALGLSPRVFAKLKIIAGSRVAEGGVLIVTARRYRTQEANRQDARERVAAMIAEAHRFDPPRKATKPTRAAKARRVDEKKGRAVVKAGRGKVRID